MARELQGDRTVQLYPERGKIRTEFNRNGKMTATKTSKRHLEALTEAAECLKVLAHPVRLRFVQLLLAETLTVGELAEACQIPQNVASEHLRLMQRCGFLDSRREGRRVYYEVVEPHLAEILACVESRFPGAEKR